MTVVGRRLAGGVAFGAIALACAFAPGLASAATLDVPADFDSIQEAVDAADPGDTVAVRARSAAYLESVEVTTADIAIVGVKGRPVVDGFDLDDTPATIQVEASDVEVRNLTVINEDGYDCDADGCTVRDVTFRGFFSGDCVEVDGDDALVADSRFAACGNEGIDVEGADARILRNSADGIDADCIAVDGPRPRIKGNRSVRCEDDQGIEVDNGDDAVVQGNVVRKTDSGGIFVEGDDVLIRDNDAQLMDSDCYELTGDGGVLTGNVGIDCEAAIDVRGDEWTIRENRVGDTNDSPCIRVLGGQEVISENRVDDCYKGIELRGEGNDEAGGEGTVTRNRIGDVHTDDGIGIFCEDDPDNVGPPDATACDEVLIEDNLVDGTGDDDAGISVSIEDGTGTAVIRGNTVRDAFDDGIEAFMDNGLVDGNTVTRAGAEEEEGIDVSGTGNVIQNNVSTRNGGDGISVRGDESFGNVIRNNTVRGNHQDGIRTEGDGDLVSGNVAVGNNGDGIEVDGVLVDVLDNAAARNRVDCAADGSVDENEDNDCADGSDFLVFSSGLPS